MSASLTVYLQADELPPVEQWQAELDRLGGELQLDPQFDPAVDSGFWPVELVDGGAGFELYHEPAHSPPAELGDPAGYELQVVFRFGRAQDQRCAMFAAAALAGLSAGQVRDDEDGTLITTGELLDVARSIVRPAGAITEPVWQELVSEHLLDDLAVRWPSVTVHGPWIVCQDDGPVCHTIGWGTPSYDETAVHTSAVVHLDTAVSGMAAADLSVALGGSGGRPEPLPIPADPRLRARAMANLGRRMLTEGARFFERHPNSTVIAARLLAEARLNNDQQWLRLADVASLIGPDDPTQAAAVYAMALRALDQELAHKPALASDRDWIARCRDAATDGAPALQDLLLERADRYRRRCRLPPRAGATS